MAKKKNRKKHQFKHVRPEAASGTMATAEAQAQPKPKPERTETSTASPKASSELSYVTSDMKRIVLIGSGFGLLQVLLWYLLATTELGDKVYSLIRL
jgi:hypothetical protein